MAEKGIYKCNVCGNVVSMVMVEAGTLVCCDQDMELLKPKTAEQEGKEKHVPVIEKTEDGVKVNVGSVPHPMEDKHWIGMIGVMKDGTLLYGKKLKPGQVPEAEFCIEYSEDLKAIEYCNLHGLWTS